MDMEGINPLAIPETLSLVLEFCDFESLKNSRLVNKTWYVTSARIIRRKSIINLTNDNLPSIVATLDDSAALFGTTCTFPSTSFRIKQCLHDSPSFVRLFNNYSNLVHSILDISCEAFHETFSQCPSIDFSSHVFNSLKEVKVTSIYYAWGHHMWNADERYEMRKCIFETIFSFAPNLQKLHLDLRLGPSEWAAFLKSAAGKLNSLKKLYFQLFVTEDLDEYYADGKFVKDNALDPVFLQQFPNLVREIGPELFSIDSLSLDIISDDRTELPFEIMQGVLEFLTKIRTTLVHSHIRFICQHPKRDDDMWKNLTKSFPVMNRVETSKLEFLYTEEPVFPDLPLNKYPKLRKFSLGFALQEEDLDQVNIEKWVNAFQNGLGTGNKTVTELDLESFSLVGFSSEVLPQLSRHFMALKVLKVDFHPTCKLGAENWATICRDLRRLEVLGVRVLNGDKDYYAIQCDGTGAASERGKVLAEDGINWAEVLTGIPEGAIRRLRKKKEEFGEDVEEWELQSLRVCPSLVDLENLRVFKLLDKSPSGILNDDICQFGFMKMKRLKQLHLTSAKNISDECMSAMQLVVDIFTLGVDEFVMDTSPIIEDIDESEGEIELTEIH